MKTKGYKHQIEGVEKSRAQSYFAYFMEMGTGKSWCLLADMERAYNEHEIDCLVLLAPKGVYRNWENKEIPTHLSIPHDVYVWSSSFTERQERLFKEGVLRKSYKLKILIFNIEALISKRAFNLATLACKTFSCALAIDESTSIKNIKSQRTESVLNLSDLATLKRLLTGSPITKSPYDLYAQSEFLHHKLLGFSDFLTYRHYYAIIEKGYSNAMAMRWNPETKQKEMMRVTYERVVGYKNLDQLNNRIQPWSYRCLKKDCLDLPEKVYLTRDVDPTPEQIKAYNEMKDMCTMEVEQGSVTASIALVKFLKMHRILCGHIKKDDGTLIEIPSNRIKELINLLDESQDQKIIIWVKYAEDARKVVEVLSEVYGAEAIVQFHGGVTDKEREISKKRIQEDPTCHFFVASKAACKGLTLTSCTLMVFYSYDFDWESWAQAEDRIHRIGMTSCTIVHMRVIGSIDEKILASHKSKELISEAILLKQVEELPKL